MVKPELPWLPSPGQLLTRLYQEMCVSHFRCNKVGPKEEYRAKGDGLLDESERDANEKNAEVMIQEWMEGLTFL